MSKICLKNIKSQLRDCLLLQRSSRFAYSLKRNNEALICEMLRVYKPSNLKARWRIFCLITHRTIKKIRRYSNPVSIRGDQGIGIRSRCLRIAEPHPTNRAKELCNFIGVLKRGKHLNFTRNTTTGR